MKYTKETIQDKLVTDDMWLIRGLLAIYNKQTSDEQAADDTFEDNGVGFNGVDGYILSQFAKQYKSKGWLSPKQIALTRRKMKKYAGQLSKIANGSV